MYILSKEIKYPLVTMWCLVLIKHFGFMKTLSVFYMLLKFCFLYVLFTINTIIDYNMVLMLIKYYILEYKILHTWIYRPRPLIYAMIYLKVRSKIFQQWEQKYLPSGQDVSMNFNFSLLIFQDVKYLLHSKKFYLNPMCE